MKRRLIVLAAALAALAAVAATPAAAHQPVQVTAGRVVTLPGGADLGYDIEGIAVMVRTPAHGGRTFVVATVRGLDPNTTYPAHVHNAACDATPPGGSHYQRVAGGPVNDENEIWPTITTGRRGNGLGTATHEAWAREDARSIVIHYPADTSIRLACVDLR
jgi:superoxide dismutase, Cu-Zn family